MSKVIFKQFVELKKLNNYHHIYFKLKPTSKDIYFIDHYCRSEKKYCCCKFDNGIKFFKLLFICFFPFELLDVLNVQLV